MITIYTGKVGSGKSYNATWAIIEALDAGRKVITNTDIYPEKIAKWIASRWWNRLKYNSWNDEYLKAIKIFKNIKILDDDDVENFWCYGFSNSLFVLDELHEYFNARDTMKTNRILLNYLSQHRKGDDDIIILTQNVNQVDIIFRRLTTHFIHWHKSSDIPFFKWTQLFPFRVVPLAFIGRVYYGENTNTNIANLIRRPNKAVFGLYDTKARHTSKRLAELKNRLMEEKLKLDDFKINRLTTNVPVAGTSDNKGSLNYVELINEYR